MTQLKRKDIDTDLIEPTKVKIPQPQRISVSKFGMVSTAHYLATRVGAQVLEVGGNAIDAAVASAFALGECESQASGLGGQTMMLLFLADEEKVIALDGSSRAPNRALNENFNDKSMRRIGYAAATVPSTPATLAYALERYGRLKLTDVLDHSLALAENGYPITELQHRLQARLLGVPDQLRHRI